MSNESDIKKYTNKVLNLGILDPNRENKIQEILLKVLELGRQAALEQAIKSIEELNVDKKS